MTSPELWRRVERVEQDLTAIADTVLEIKDTVDRHSEELVVIRQTQGRHTQVLTGHSQVLDQHTRTLDQHTRTLDQHTRTLDQHTRTLDQHTRTLDQHTRTLDQHTGLLNEILRRLDPR